MKFTKLLAVVLSLAIAATAMLTSGFALSGVITEGDVTGVEFDLLELYPALKDASAWANGVSIDFTYEIDGLQEVVEGYGIGCGGNAALFIKYGEDYTWKDKNVWSYDVNWMADKSLECNTAELQFDTAGAEIKAAGFRLYNFQQAADGDLDSIIIGKDINVEVLDLRIGEESQDSDEPGPADSEEEPTSEEEPVSEEEPAPEGAYIKATVDNEAGTVTLSTVDFPEGIYGLQFAINPVGGSFTEIEKGKLPAGWSETYPTDITDGFTAVYDCDFSTALGDQDILVIKFAPNTDLTVEISGGKAVNADFQGVDVASQVVKAEPKADTDTDEPAPVDSEKEPTSEVPGKDPETKDVDTGVVSFASIIGIVTLAGAVASKKR